jgi:hypothetical protein
METWIKIIETWIKIIVGAAVEFLGVVAKTLAVCYTVHWFLEDTGLLALITAKLK